MSKCAFKGPLFLRQETPMKTFLTRMTQGAEQLFISAPRSFLLSCKAAYASEHLDLITRVKQEVQRARSSMWQECLFRSVSRCLARRRTVRRLWTPRRETRGNRLEGIAERGRDLQEGVNEVGDIITSAQTGIMKRFQFRRFEAM